MPNEKPMTSFFLLYSWQKNTKQAKQNKTPPKFVSQNKLKKKKKSFGFPCCKELVETRSAHLIERHRAEQGQWLSSSVPDTTV